MAKHVVVDIFVEVNGVDLSDHVKSCSLTDSANEVDSSTMSALGYSSTLKGLKSWSSSVTFAQDYASSSVSDTIDVAYGLDSFILQIRPNRTNAVSATNPTYSGTASLYNRDPVGGAVGDLNELTCEFKRLLSLGD